MAKFKLPEALVAWRVGSSLPGKNGSDRFSVTKKNHDGSITKAVMTVVDFSGDRYSEKDIQFAQEEAEFIRNVKSCGDVSTYIDAAVMDNPDKKKAKLFIITEKCKSLETELKNKQLSESEITEFGLQMSEALTALEAKKIYHGNIKPSNVYVTKDGKYKLGGFSDFESSVDDLSYAAPEIKKGRRPDFTTDIYSVGLMMYSMCSGGRIPFEDEGLSREEAIEKRMEGAQVPAPKEGGEKLKSVIVIACQSKNSNRWKNAGNLKNAITSIKADEVREEPKQEIIAPAPTDFDGNVFEEYSFDEFDAAETDAQPEKAAEEPVKDVSGEKSVEAPVEAVPVAAVPVAAAVPGTSAPEKADEKADEEAPDVSAKADSTGKTADPKPEQTEAEKTAEEPEIDNRVFDDYELQTKVFNINDVKPDGEKDYGSYFDDEPEIPEQPPQSENDVQPGDGGDDFGQDGFYDDDNSFYAEQKEEEKRSRKSLVLIIAAIAAIVILLSIIGVMAFNNGLFNGSNKVVEEKQTVPSSAAVTASTSPSKPTQPTTAAPTTVPETTKESEELITPYNVLGAYYDYAKSMLEEQGFKVKQGESYFSEYYEEGLVMSMDPDSTMTVKKGSTITLYVSKGLKSEQTEPATEPEEKPESSQSSQSNQSQQQEENNNDNNSSDNGGSEEGVFSPFAGNTSYLSRAEVNEMTRTELNIMRNEIYARRGRIFKDSYLDHYFRAQSWYTPTYTPEEFFEKVTLNDYENKNIQLIYDTQLSKGYL